MNFSKFNKFLLPFVGLRRGLSHVNRSVANGQRPGPQVETEPIWQPPFWDAVIWVLAFSDTLPLSQQDQMQMAYRVSPRYGCTEGACSYRE